MHTILVRGNFSAVCCWSLGHVVWCVSSLKRLGRAQYVCSIVTALKHVQSGSNSDVQHSETVLVAALFSCPPLAKLDGTFRPNLQETH